MGLNFVILFICALAWITGGTTVQIGKMKLEILSLDFWVLMFIVVTLVHKKNKKFFLEKGFKFFEWISTKGRSEKATFFLCLWIFSSLWIAHCLRHLSFQTHAFDLTFLHQSLFNPFAPRALTCDLCDGGSYFGEHMAFSLFLLAPLTSFLKNLPFHDFFIFLLQVIILAFPLVLAHVYGPLKNKKELWFFSFFILFCFRSYRNSISWDFREDDLAFFFLSGSLLALFCHRKAVFVACIICALLSKENLAIVVPFIGFPIFFEKSFHFTQKEKQTLTLFVICISVFIMVVEFKWLIPLFSDRANVSHPIVVRFKEFGKTPAEVLITLLTSPAAWGRLLAEHFFKIQSLKYLLLLLLPFVSFIMRAWVWLLPVIPGVAMNVFSGAETQRSLNFHYDLIIFPFLFFGIWISLAQKTSLKQILVALLIALASSGRWPGRQISQYWPSFTQVKDSLYLGNIPTAKGILTAELSLLAQVSNQPELRSLVLPEETLSASRYLLDLSHPLQKKLEEKIIQTGWLKISQSPSGRYILYQSPNVTSWVFKKEGASPSCVAL